MMENRKPIYVVDVEANSLLDDVTKIHVLSYTHVSKFEPVSLTDPDEIREFFKQEGLTLIMHNGVRYDAEALKKVLGIEVNYRIIDTLAVAWALESSSGRRTFGLESYGEELGVPKIEVGSDVWDGDMNDPCFRDLMIQRCETDIKINYLLWKKQQDYLINLYDRDSVTIHRFLDYLTFKMDCFREQMETGFELDLDLCLNEMIRLETLSEEKVKALSEAMPKIANKVIRRKPKVMYKADKSLSAHGTKWLQLLVEHKLPPDTEEVEVITGYEEANPNSSEQVKSWLYSLGWKPQNIKFQRDKKTGNTKEIPQIVSEFDKSEVCDSVKKLIPKEPSIEHLSGLSTINHRVGVLKGFIRDMKDGRIYQDIAGLTNTLRVRHKYLVNLPKIGNPYAENIRACLSADKGKMLIGSDVSGLEDKTKISSIYHLDPEYVKDLLSRDYDSHTDVAVKAKMMTADEERFFKWYSDPENYEGDDTQELKNMQELSATEQKELMGRLKDIRQRAKVVNFSAVYSVGAKTLARNMGVSVKEAQFILDAYWDRNKSVKQFAATIERKTVDGQMWVKQPVSGFWYSLRYEKDIFSVINQGCGCYCFDMWVKHLRKNGLRMSLQSHDEVCVQVDEDKVQEYKELINKCMEDANKEIKLNVPLGCSIDVGKNYKETH